MPPCYADAASVCRDALMPPLLWRAAAMPCLRRHAAACGDDFLLPRGCYAYALMVLPIFSLMPPLRFRHVLLLR